MVCMVVVVDMDRVCTHRDLSLSGILVYYNPSWKRCKFSSLNILPPFLFCTRFHQSTLLFFGLDHRLLNIWTSLFNLPSLLFIYFSFCYVMLPICLVLKRKNLFVFPSKEDKPLVLLLKLKFFKQLPKKTFSFETKTEGFQKCYQN